MLRKLLCVVVLLGGTAPAAMAQANFQPAYILPPAGDTIRGEADARNDQRNTRICRFRPVGGTITEYAPGQLRGYGFADGRHFESLALPQPLDKLDVAFLQRLTPGPAMLYTLRDLSNAEHFYLRTAAQPALQELTQTVAMVNNEQGRYRSTDNQYQRTLAQAFRDCPAVQAAIPQARFTALGLTKVVAQYNACISGAAAPAPATGLRTNSARLRLVGGAEHATIHFDGSTVFDQQSFSATAPVYGLSLLLRPRAFNEHLSMALDALYSTFKATGSFQTAYQPVLYGKEQEARFDISSLRVPLLVRYTYSRGPVQPFIGAGVEVSLALKHSAEYRYRFVSSSPYSAWASEDRLLTRKLEQGVVAVAGLTTARATGRNAALELRASRSNGFSDISGTGNRFVRFTALLALDLTK